MLGASPCIAEFCFTPSNCSILASSKWFSFWVLLSSSIAKRRCLFRYKISKQVRRIYIRSRSEETNGNHIKLIYCVYQWIQFLLYCIELFPFVFLFYGKNFPQLIKKRFKVLQTCTHHSKKRNKGRKLYKIAQCTIKWLCHCDKFFSTLKNHHRLLAQKAS